MCDEDFVHLGPNKSQVRPVLCTKEDQQALWDNMAYIDCIATDHGNHFIANKINLIFI